MSPPDIAKPRVFVDSDALFAGAAASSRYGASLVLLRMAEITLIDALVCHQVITEVERNLSAKLPAALPAFKLLVSKCLRVTPDPTPAELIACQGLADPKDLPILAAAVREQCPWLVTFNGRHFQPGHPAVTVLRPGEFIMFVREHLVGLSIRND